MATLATAHQRCDPTKTVSLRRQFASQVLGRVKQVAALLKGFDDNWSMESSAHRLHRLRTYLNETLRHVVLDLSKPHTQSYIYRAVYRAYIAGCGHAYDDTYLGKPAKADRTATKQEFIDGALISSEYRDRLELLVWQTTNELEALVQDVVTRVVRSYANDLVLNFTKAQLAKFAAQLGTSITKAKTIANTEIVRALNEGILDSYQRLGKRDVKVLVEWATAEQPCKLCAVLDGVVLTLKEARGLLPRHPNCVTGDTVIEAVDPSTVMMCKYTGVIVEFVTAIGTKLSVTPNHIMLTQRGWVFAKDVKDTDYLVSGTKKFPAIIPSVVPNYDTTQATISEVFKAFVEMGDEHLVTEPLPVPEQFHGDGGSINSEIYIVSADSPLSSDSQSSSNAQIIESFLSGGNVIVTESFGLSGKGSLSSFLVRASTTADRLVCLTNSSELFIARQGGHHKFMGFTLPSDSDPSILESSVDESPGNTKHFAESLSADALRVEFNNLINGNLLPITSKLTRHVEDLPVYDVSTEQTAYVANGIITSNCKCRYIAREYVGVMGADLAAGRKKRIAALKRSIALEKPKTGKRRRVGRPRTSQWTKTVKRKYDQI